MKQHFHRCPQLRTIEVDASELSGKRRGGGVILEELCAARHLARCVGLLECTVLAWPQKRELLVARATQLRAHGDTSPLSAPEGPRREALDALRAELLDEREDIVIRNREVEAGLAFAVAELEGAEHPDAPEEASRYVPLHLADAQRELRLERLDAIDRGLSAMASVDYGVCLRCRQPIEAPRLRELPDTHLCEECARSALPEEALSAPPLRGRSA
jgi:RNA polymerase-binding transcription factor DksA